MFLTREEPVTWRETAIVAADCAQVNNLAHAAVDCKRAEAQAVILS
jgi:hypothetical protein